MALMGEKYDMVEGDVDQISRRLEVPYPNSAPYHEITAVVVAWNEEPRIGPLLSFLSDWFTHLNVAVQKSTDDTLRIAQSIVKRKSDKLFEDPHYGHGDASFPRLIDEVDTDWAFVVSCDEWPDLDLMRGLESATNYATRFNYDGVWLYFRSFTEGIEWKVEHGHLRLFWSKLGWPGTLHSRPMARRAMWWPFGHIIHSRSADEMVADYLSYLEVGRRDAEKLGIPYQWDPHNIQQLHDVAIVAAEAHDWEWVRNRPWWPEVEAIAFKEEHPWQ